jgi:glycosyltransferase involved in cell wall biosynthesis
MPQTRRAPDVCALEATAQPLGPALADSLTRPRGFRMLFAAMERGTHVLFVSRLGEQSASHRFRVLKLLPLLRAAGVRADAVRVQSLRDLLPLLHRFLRTPREQRLVVFQKSIMPPLGRFLRRLGATLVMDIDDGGDQRIDGSDNPEVEDYQAWTRLMDASVVSVDSLVDWIAEWSPRTFTIPTCLDVQSYTHLGPRDSETCTIGWVGGGMAPVVLPPIKTALADVCRDLACEFVAVAGADPGLGDDFPNRFVPWRLELEPDVFGSFDIGIMPLPDNPRARNKSAFKLLQYMAAGLPVVATPVGMNRDLVVHGWNGYIAESLDDWRDALARLASDPVLRRELGANGRALVAEKHDMRLAADAWVGVLEELAG